MFQMIQAVFRVVTAEILSSADSSEGHWYLHNSFFIAFSADEMYESSIPHSKRKDFLKIWMELS
jgi:hypothetical protein